MAVVAIEAASPLLEPKEGEMGVGVGVDCSTLLTDPAFELAALWGALVTPAAPL